MRVRKLLPAIVFGIAGLIPPSTFACHMSSPQADSPSAPAAELDPIIIDTAAASTKTSEVVLSIDLDSNGSVAHAKAISGPKPLAASAIGSAKMLRYPDRPKASGLLQRIIFRPSAEEVRAVAPEYPGIAGQAHAAGVVQLIATIDAAGKVTDVTVIWGHPLLRAGAENALRQWIFKPTLRNGIPVPGHAIVRFNFDLNHFPN